MAVAPATRRASDRQRPCHPPLALAPRRLYTSPMRNPTSACPRLPDAARGISPRSTNCPENSPPYPQNGSCWTRRIVSAVDGFEADSFPNKENLGGGTNRRSSPRPQGPPRRLLRRRRLGRAPHPPAVAPAHPPPTRPARPGGISRQRTINAQNHAEATGSLHQANNQPFVYLPGSEAAKKAQTIHRTITIKQPAAGGDPLRRRRTGATPSLCGALQCPKPQPRDTTRSLEHYGDPCTTIIPTPPPRWIPAHPRLGDPATLPLQGRRASDPPWRPHNPPPTKPSRQRPAVAAPQPSPHKAVAQRPPATGSVT